MKDWRKWISVLFVALSAAPFAAADIPARGQCGRDPQAFPDLYEASIHELQSGLESGDYTSVDLVTAYLKRIDEVNFSGPKLHAVLETNQHALDQAIALDVERKTRGKRSPLHGIPILVKDNIATRAADGMNTTAGSYALLGSIVPGDSHAVAKLRAAGAIILGKANLSQWSYIRDWTLPNGWSSRGGQVTNPYFPQADPCGSSSGSAVAAAVGLAAAALGTDTAGSIVCPSGFNNVVGVRPSLGLTSRTGVVPVSLHQDTVGPIGRSVADVAALLSVIAGQDDADNYTSTAPNPVPDYTQFLNADAIRGKRFGVPRKVFTDDSFTGSHPSVNVEFNKTLDIIRSLGGIVVDPADLPSALKLPDVLMTTEMLVFQVDLKVDLNRYLNTLESIPTDVKTLEDVISFNNAHRSLERPKGHTGQSIFIGSQSTHGYNSTFYSALDYHKEVSRTEGIDAVLKNHNLDAIVLPNNGLSMLLASLAGYPMVTVPLGFLPDDTPITPNPQLLFPAPGVPFGVAFIGRAYSEPDLIGFAYAYEQHTHTRLKRRAYTQAVPHTQIKDVIQDCPKENIFNHQIG
ncbi:amidase [Ceratobasidium sp. AG-Ba]|nr:amidase [Ceratobasidium sp. AG-Ba]